ncbi:MAG: PEP-CTERM sorting domain-containing protein [Lentisphaeria bacterium]|nr:PEP-CTERM sorting domain-containing protein [Lentisphaeria bacterium]
MKTFSTIIIATAMAIGFASQAAQIITGSATLNVVYDVEIRSSSPTGVQPSDGQTIVGVISSSDIVRGLFHFDTSSLGIPSEATAITVDSISLTTPNSGVSLGGIDDLYVYEYAYDFVESSATWNNPDGVAGGDSTPGGSFNALAPLTYDDSGYSNLTYTSDFNTVIEDAILAGGTINLLLKDLGEASTGTGYVRYTEDGFTLAFDYQYEIPEPSTALLAGLGLMGACFRRRRR